MNVRTKQSMYLLLRSSLILAMFGLTTAVVADDCGAAKGAKQVKEQKPQKAEVGKAAPDFTLKDCYGKEHTLSDHKDKLVVLEWVNQQCPYYIRAIPLMKKLHQKYEDQDIVWLGVESTHWRKPDENKKLIKQKELGYTILMDNDGQVGRLYEAKTTPHIYVINKGKLVYAGALNDDPRGSQKESEVRNYVDEALAAVLAGKDVPLAETKPWGCSVKYAKDKPDKQVSRAKPDKES